MKPIGRRLYTQRTVAHMGHEFIVRRVRLGAVIFNKDGRYLARVKVGQLRMWLDYFAKEKSHGNA